MCEFDPEKCTLDCSQYSRCAVKYSEIRYNKIENKILTLYENINKLSENIILLYNKIQKNEADFNKEVLKLNNVLKKAKKNDSERKKTNTSIDLSIESQEAN